MAKRLNLFILIMLLVGQTILTPLASTSVIFAEGDGSDDGNETEEVDKEELTKLLKEMEDEQYEEVEYEADSFQTFVKAVTAGEDVAEDLDANEEEVNNAIDDIKEAVNGLQEKKPKEEPEEETEKKEEKDADKTALKALLDEINDLEKDAYIEDSYKSLMDAAKDAKKVVDNEDATQDEVDKAVNTVKEARDGLEHSIATLNDNDEPKEIEENIIDEIILKREDGSIYEEGDQLDPNEDLELGLEWSLPNDPMYVGGDTFTFQLPEQLAIYSEITGDLDDFGTFVVTTEGEVTFTFNDKINENSNVKGTFWVKTELDKQKITTSTEELEFVFNEDVAKKITINVKPEGGQAIHKEGQPIGGNFNTDEIEWTVLINTTKDELENAIVTDKILDGQELDLDSIKLQEIEVNLAGEEVGVLGDAKDFTNASTQEKLKLELGDTNKAYKLTFKTKIKDSEKDEEGWKDYSNTAYLNSDGKDEKESGAKVSVQRPESLTKSSSSFDKENRSVKWEVNANFTEKSLKEGDEIVDEFTFTIGDNDRTEAFEISKDDIDILQVDNFTDNGEVDSTSDAKDLFDISIVDNKVTYKLKEDSNKAFIIKYKTSAKDGAYIDNDGKISNTVEIDGNTKTSEQHVGQQVGVKGNKGIDYENKTIDWEITINADKQDLRNFILTDDFSGSGQQLVDGSIEVDPSISNDQINANDDGEGFVIDFGDITETYTITYQTEFTYDFEGEETPNFHNGVDITYETDDGTEYELEIDNDVDPNNNTKNNGVKNGTADNETKEITWTVDVNYNNLTLTDAKVIDEIADNQSLVDESVKVYETSIDSGGNITTGDDVTEDFDVTAEENLVEVLFGGEIDQSHRIEFKTKDKDGIYNSDEVYENTAQFIPREGEEHKLKASVTLPNQGEFLGKSGLHNKDNWTVDWKIDVNKSQSKLNGVTVKDDLGEDGSQILLEDSFKVTKAGSDEELDEDAYELTIDGNAFSIKFDGEITDAYEITYSSYILAGETANLKNEAEIESVEEEIVGSVEKEEEVEVKISTGGGTAEGSTGGLTLEKTEKDTGRVLKDVKFTLLTTIGDQEIVVREGTTDEEGKLEWAGLRYGDYTLKEEIPEGYTGEETQEVTIKNDSLEDGVLTLKDKIVNERQTGTAKIVKKDATTGKELLGAEFTLINQETGHEYTFTTKDNGEISEEVAFGEYTVEEVKAPNGYRITEDINNIDVEIDKTATVEVANEAIVKVEGQKTWHESSDDNRPDSITVELLANGTQVDEQEVTTADDWKYSFTDLDKYNPKGNKINYSIKEVEVEGYNTHQDGNDLTNIETTEVSGTKTWIDDDSNNRPDEITVKLLADGEKITTEKATAESDWKYEFTDLDKFDEDGEEITYTIEEVELDGYETTIDGFDIENVRVGKIDVEGEKTWQDVDATERPDDIIVELSREIDGEKDKNFSEEKTVTPDNQGDWTYAFTDLDEFNDEGVAYTYIVEEIDVPEEYKSEVNDHDITNTRTGITEVSGTKRWKDDTEEDRPDEITINLLRNNVVVATEEVTADDNWKYEFTDLEKYDDEGQLYEYTVKEQDVEGYHSEVKGTDITNTRAEKKDIEVNKAWLDDKSEERPESIVVYLKQNGANFDTVELKAENDWKYKFTDLEAFDENGHAYSYSVEEKAIEGYETTIDGFDITNLRVGETEVSGTKTWLDDDSEDRPENITVKLLANGEETGETVTVDADSDWAYEFTELDKYDEQGKEITYTVDEAEVDGYEKSFDGHDITNLRVGKTEVTGEKNWVEEDDRYRPDSITVNLLANGEEKDTIKVSDETDWSYAFTGLDKYDDKGREIEYTIEESDIPKGYESEVDDFDVTNTQKTTEVSGEKIWDEVDAQYRPDDVTIQLLANGEEETTVEISDEDDWKYEFTDLAKYDKDGVEINYTVEELDVPAGYESKVDEYNITNKQKSTEVTGEKEWDEVDERYRPDSITVQLLANDEKVESVEVSADTDWTYEFADLAKYDKDGEEIDYTVEEIDVPKGYDSEVDGYEITNTQKETSVTGEKSWDEVDDQYRPDNVTIQLLANGEEETTVEVSSETDWTYEFTDLAKYDKDGKEIDYTVKETDVPAGYDSEVDGFNITNTQKSTEVSGTKTWLDDDSEDRPETITVYLLANDDQVDEVEVSAEDDWSYEFTKLAAYDKEGKEIEYTVEEDVPTGYEANVDDDFNITNLRVGTTDVEVTKQWKDEQNTDRPDTIKVNLLQNGDFHKEYEVKAKNDWKLAITGLPKYDDKGVAYEYSVTEHDVPGYESKVDGFDITNTRSDEKTIEITKTWLDDDAKDRPNTIEVELFRSIQDDDAESVDTYTLTADEDWSLKIKDLPTFDKDGKAYTYEIKEKEVEGYETSINGFEITNLRVGETEVTGTKTWLDDDSKDRPDSITVELFANGESIDTIDVTSKSDWEYEFTELPKYDEEGKEIEYTIDEKPVDGYESKIDGFDITNTLVVEEDSEKPSDDKDKSDKTGGKDSSDEDKGGILPSTATNTFNLLLAGALLLVAGTGFTLYRRRKA